MNQTGPLPPPNQTPNVPQAFKDMPLTDQLAAIYSVVQFWSADNANQRRLLVEWQDDLEKKLDDFMDDFLAARQARAEEELVIASTTLEAKKHLAASPTNGALTTTQRDLLKNIAKEQANKINLGELFRKHGLPAAIGFATVLVLTGVTSFIGFLILLFLNR